MISFDYIISKSVQGHYPAGFPVVCYYVVQSSMTEQLSLCDVFSLCLP